MVVSQTCQSYWWQAQNPLRHTSRFAGQGGPHAAPLIWQPLLVVGTELQVSPVQHPAQFWLQCTVVAVTTAERGPSPAGFGFTPTTWYDCVTPLPSPVKVTLVSRVPAKLVLVPAR